MTTKLIYLFIAFILAGCAGATRKQTQQFNSFVNSGQYQAAITMLESGGLYSGEESLLLKYLELGTLYHLQGNYYQSLTFFDAAQELSDKLFTVSVKKKIASYMASDNADNYYGEIFERSQIRFYRALNHLLLAQQGFYEPHPKNILSRVQKKKKVDKDEKQVVANLAQKKLTAKQRRFHYQAARSVIIEWDSYLSTQQKSLKGYAQFKDDLSQKVFGAHIHRRMNNRSDHRIAKSLYENSKDVLFQNYNIYPTYNARYLKFKEDFSKLHQMKKNVVASNYVTATNHTKTFLSMVDEGLKSIKKKVKKKSLNKRVSFLIRTGRIPLKKVSKTNFPIGFNTLTYRSVGKQDFISFVRKVLAISAGGIPTISFELPRLDALTGTKAYKLQIKNETGSLVREKKLAVINPLKDLVHEALNKRLPELRKKVGVRLAAKHLAALMTSYLAYRSSSKKNGNLLAMSVATAGYYIANRSIAASERADLRSWQTLPEAIQMAELELKPGSYQIFLMNEVSGVVRQLKGLTIDQQEDLTLYSQRVL